MREGTGKSAYRRLPNSVPFAGKTGTTNNYRDSWFAGFSPGVTAVVWLGRDDNERTSLTGATGALTVWTDIMRKLPHRHGRIQAPRGVEWKPLNEQGQYMDPRNCQGGREIPVSVESRLETDPRCERRGWFRNWFDREDREDKNVAPREDMTPGWGIDPEQQRREEQQRQREQQLREQLDREQPPVPQEQPETDRDQVPQTESERLRRLEESGRLQEERYLEEERRAQEERRNLEERLRQEEERLQQEGSRRGAPVEDAQPWPPEAEPDQWP